MTGNHVIAAVGLQDDWQAKVKRFFIVPLMLFNVGFVVLGIVTGWWGVVLAAAAQFVLFGMITAKRTRYVGATPALVIGAAGLTWAITDSVGAAVFAALAYGLLLIYVFWYSYSRRTPSAALTVGSPFPALDFADLEGNVVSSASWAGTPTVLIFYRGNWCPLCNVQVRELSEGYRDIESLGARVVLVSPQPAEESAKLARQFDAPMTFLVDDGNAAARALGIQHPGGAPLGIVPEGESVLPTAIVVDRDGVIRFAHETDNYRFRPDPALFLDALRGLPA
ncbi:MAG: peroxiredoxin [Candidatus Aldehydirespiratoraceae bacterium]|jgi:peroxiredoxin